MASIPCKNLKTLIVSELQKLLELRSIISPHQFAFSAGHTTTDQLTMVYGDVSKRVDLGSAVYVIFLCQ